MKLLHNVNAYIGGSVSCALFMRQLLRFTPNDIDVYIEDVESNKAGIAKVKECMELQGYAMDDEKSFTGLSNKLMKQYTAADNEHIKEIWSMFHPGLKKTIQIILLDMSPSNYILYNTDLSCSAVALKCEPTLRLLNTMLQKTDYYIRLKTFYINNSTYQDIYDGKCGDKKREKLMSRIKKYESRGFKFIGAEPTNWNPGNYYFNRIDSVHKAAKKIMVHSIADYDDVQLYAALRRDDSIVVYTNAKKGYLVDRLEFYKYCAKHHKTYWGHKLYVVPFKNESCASVVLFEMYRLFVLREVNMGLYVIECKQAKDVISEKGLRL